MRASCVFCKDSKFKEFFPLATLVISPLIQCYRLYPRYVVIRYISTQMQIIIVVCSLKVPALGFILAVCIHYYYEYKINTGMMLWLLTQWF